MTRWTTTVDELLIVFRDAITVLVPVVERAKIGWRESEAYDDWDAITNVLFEEIIVASVRWSLAEKERKTFKMAPYNVLIESYHDLTFISVTAAGLGKPAAFHSFATTSDIFDTVRVREVNESGDVTNPKLIDVPIDGVKSLLRTIGKRGPSEVERIIVNV